MGYSRTKSKGARARLGGAPGCANLCYPSLRGPRLPLHSYLRLSKLQSWTIPWDSNAVFIIFCNFRVPSQNSASFSKFSVIFPSPPPCGKLKLGKNAGCTRNVVCG